MVAVEQFHEAGLSSGGSLDTAHGDAFDLFFDAFDVEREILKIERKALADGRQLCGLVMREAEGRHIFVFFRIFREDSGNFEEFAENDSESVAHLDDLCVVGDETAGRTEMDDRHCGGALGPEHMAMAHDVMAEFGLFPGDGFKINIVEMGFHLVDLFLRDGQAEFLFGLREGDPQTAPGGMFALRGPVEAHFRSGVAVGQRTLIGVVAVHVILSSDNF